MKPGENHETLLSLETPALVVQGGEIGECLFEVAFLERIAYLELLSWGIASRCGKTIFCLGKPQYIPQNNVMYRRS